jgi:LasA protease
MIHKMMHPQDKRSGSGWVSKTWRRWWISLSVFSLVLSACQPAGQAAPVILPTPTEIPEPLEIPTAAATALPTRPIFSPGELVDYMAQTGDILVALASRFNTTVAEILEANSFIPADATTMPPGMPMQIPIYYRPFWGSQYQIIPDSLFINGPAQVSFNTAAFLAEQPGWFSDYVEYAFGGNRTGAQIVDYVALQFSLSPRILLTLLEYQAGGLTQPVKPADLGSYVLGNADYRYRGVYLQLVWAANMLNDGYYRYRAGALIEFEHLDGRIETIDPWQNAATASLQYYFSHLLDGDAYLRAVAHDGAAQVYRNAFGDAWEADEPHLPGSLTQPELTLPFKPGLAWAFTGGPHTAYGSAAPYAALDFAPGAISGGCTPSEEEVTAVAPGVVARSETGTVVLDLDGDGDERTGWAIFYFHIGTQGRTPVGTVLQTGDPLGYPSCEGGRATGTHVHIARKYNGEWMLADGALAFNLEGWIAHNGSQAYLGTLTRGGRMVTACECTNADSFIESGK